MQPKFLRTRGGRLVQAVGAAWLWAACNGAVGDSREPGGSGGDSDTPSDDEPGTPGTPSEPLPKDCVAADLPPVVRLSRSEYLNALGDLFPGYEGASNFPMDTGLAGFDNEADSLFSNRVLVAAVSDDADARAAWAMKDVKAFTGCDPKAADEGCARGFVETFGRRALRRPLTSEEIQSYMDLFQAGKQAVDFAGGLQLAISGLLQAPEFLYRLRPDALSGNEATELRPYETASRLSFGLWQAGPDDALLDAAAEGRLDDEAGIRRELGDMVERAPEKLRRTLGNLHLQWFDVDRILDPRWHEKDQKMFPEWSEEMVTSVYSEAADFIDLVMFEEAGGLEALLTSTRARLDAQTAKLYGQGNQGVVDLPEARAGIFARAAFLASHAHQRNGSPPLRGTAIMEQAFCMPPPTPPADVDTSNPGEDADSDQLTNRELFERRTSPSACFACHRTIDAFAYPLEAFDAIGKHRDEDKGKPVNVSTKLSDTDIDGTYANWPETAKAMASSAMVHGCAASHFARFALNRQPSESESCVVEDLTAQVSGGSSFLDVLERATLYRALAGAPGKGMNP